MSNTNKSAAPARALSATPWLLAAVVALEITGMQALSNAGARTLTAAAADGGTIYATAGGTGTSAADVVARAGD